MRISQDALDHLPRKHGGAGRPKLPRQRPTAAECFVARPDGGSHFSGLTMLLATAS